VGYDIPKAGLPYETFIHAPGMRAPRSRQVSKRVGMTVTITGAWSPDGKQIMFALDQNNNEDSGQPNTMYVMNANGTGLRTVIGGQDFIREPDWER
jgi:Tol biopolymer transport system component